LDKLSAVQDAFKGTATSSPNFDIADKGLNGIKSASQAGVEYIKRGDLLWTSGINQLTLY
jgi:hypothetical protein